MQLYIGENIKRLRRQRGITQETLAEHMHISTAAVSKWERGETLPDISMVIPLASYFGVSTDEILGLDAAKNEEIIQTYLNEYHHLGAIGKAQEKFDLMVKAYTEYPNDWRIIEEYMWQLYYDPNCIDTCGAEVHKDELFRLCDRVLDECTLDTPRYAALSILGGLYLIDNQINKAIETANRFPEYYMTKGQELENCYDRGTTEWWQQLRENIWDNMHMLQIKIRNAALYSNATDPTEQIRLLKKAVKLIELVFDDGDYGFCHYDLNELYLWIANRCVMVNNYEAAFDNYEKCLAHAKAYDDLPKISTHTSFLVRGKMQAMTQICSDTEDNEVARAINHLRSWEVYKKVKDMPKMQEILTKYEPFMGYKKDYSKHVE